METEQRWPFWKHLWALFVPFTLSAKLSAMKERVVDRLEPDVGSG